MDTTQQNSDVTPAVATSVTPTLPTFGQLWGASWRFIGGNFWRLVFVAVVGMLISLIGVVLTFGVAAMALTDTPQATLYGMAAGAFVVNMICSMIAFSLCAVAVVHGGHITLKDTVARAMALVWPLSILMFMVYAAVLAGLVALIIPGIMLIVALLPALWIVVEERVSAKMAIDRSLALVVGRWWAVCLRLLLAVLVIIGLSLAVFVVAILLIPLFFTLAVVSGEVAAIAGIALAVSGYVLWASAMGIFLTRFMYELYRGLVTTAQPQARRWWQGLPLRVLLVVGSLGLGAYIVATPYLMIEDMQEEPQIVPSADDSFSDWLEANPEFQDMSDVPALPVDELVPAESI